MVKNKQRREQNFRWGLDLNSRGRREGRRPCEDRLPRSVWGAGSAAQQEEKQQQPWLGSGEEGQPFESCQPCAGNCYSCAVGTLSLPPCFLVILFVVLLATCLCSCLCCDQNSHIPELLLCVVRL